MIVKCASCQTRFKIGDDKVTEKGVKVRCTKCGTVFTVRKGDAGGAEAKAAEAPASPSPSSAAAPASNGKPASNGAPPPAAARVAMTSLDEFLGTPSPPAPPEAAFGVDDPFGPRATEPTGRLPGEFSMPNAELNGAPTPFAAGTDLLGVTWPPAAETPPPPPPFDAALDPLGGGDSAVAAADPFAHPSQPPILGAGLQPTRTNAFGADFDATFDPLAGLSLDPSSLSLGGTEPGVGDNHVKALPDDAADLFEMSRVKSRPPISEQSKVPEPPLELKGSPRKITLPRASLPLDLDAGSNEGLSSRILNVLAGASVVVLLLLSFVIYRNGGRVDLRDPLSAVFSAFGFSRPSAALQALPTRIAQSGLYPTLHGPPILFARGKVENLTRAPVQLGLKLEIAVQGKTLATAEGLPGLMPTPEDLFDLRSPAELRALQSRLSSAPPAMLIPGASADFLLLASDLPEAVRAGGIPVELKVTAHPWTAAAASPPPPDGAFERGQPVAASPR